MFCKMAAILFRGGLGELNTNQTQCTKHNNTECICYCMHRIFLRAKQYYSNLYMTFYDISHKIPDHMNTFCALHYDMAFKLYTRAMILHNSISTVMVLET